MKRPREELKVLRQMTLDGKPYIERNRLKEEVRRYAKKSPTDHVLLVTAAPSFINTAFVVRRLDTYVDKHGKPVQVLIGEDKATGETVSTWAKDHGIPCTPTPVFPAYLKRWPRTLLDKNAAYQHRDLDLVDLADHVISFYANPNVVDYSQRHCKLIYSSSTSAKGDTSPSK